MTKEDEKMAYLEKKLKSLTHDDYKEIVFTTRDAENNPILLMYGTETGFGLIYSYIKNKPYFELWGLHTPYQVAELAYEVIKDNHFEYDELKKFNVYRFQHSGEIEYLGVKLHSNGLIEEIRPYKVNNAEQLFIDTGILDIKEV
jgi:hypothetical protein